MKKNYFLLKNSWILLLLLVSSLSFGQKTWVGPNIGDWNIAANWSPAGVPGISDDVVIGNFSVNVTNAAVCKSFTMNGTNGIRTLTISVNNSLTVSRAVTINAPTTATAANTLAVGAGTLSAASISMADTAGDSLDCILSLTTGTIIVRGDIKMAGSNLRNQVTFSGAGKLYLGGTMSGGGLTRDTGTVEYNGSASQIVGIYTYNNLTINNTSGGISLSGSTTVVGVLTMANGILKTTNANLLNVTNTAKTAITGGSTTSFINGPLKWTLPGSLVVGSTYNFPVGKGTTYLPFSLVNPTTGGTVAPTAQVEAFNSGSGGDFSAAGSLSDDEYWSLETTGNFTNSSISLIRQTAVSPFTVIAGSATLRGVYTSLGGTPSGSEITSSNLINTISPTIKNRFFSFGQQSNGTKTGTINGSPFCAGATVSVPYTIKGTFNSGNVFTAQLSDALGSFAAPITIGTLNSTIAGTISGTIPNISASGTAYKIRVVSSNPNTFGAANGTDLKVTALPLLSAIKGKEKQCPAISGTYEITAVANATSYTWTVPTGWIVTSGSNTEKIVVKTGIVGENGNIIVTATTSCGTSVAQTLAVTVNPVGTVFGGSITRAVSTPICAWGNTGVLKLSGHTGTIVKWESCTVSNLFPNGSVVSIDNISEEHQAVLTVTTHFRVFIKDGDCAETYSSVITVNVTADTGGNVNIKNTNKVARTVYVGSPSTTLLKLSGQSVGSTISRWESSTNGFTSAGTQISNSTDEYTAPSVATTTYFRAVIKSGSCEFFSEPAVIIVNSPPTITLSPKDETCSTANDGSIITSLTGGISNVRRIRLTQKYNDYQQVQEIQAFEVFTGTNLALANTVTVGSSSIYQGKPINFGPQLIIDGIISGANSSFWHSRYPVINEWVQLDFGVGKNLKYVRIYNRWDSNWSRGQKMLLELFDVDDKVVFSQVVNLWGNVNQKDHYVDVDLIDLSWADGATTYDRSNLDSGNYTLSYSEVLGNSGRTTATIESPKAPIVESKIQPTCTTKGSVVLTGLPPGTWIITTNHGETDLTGLSGIGLKTTITGLTPGLSYVFTVKSASNCTYPPSITTDINKVVITTYDGLKWSTTPPDITMSGIIASNTPIDTDVDLCDCTVNTGIVASFASGKTLKLQDKLVVNGKLTFENNASLVQINDNAANFGKITYTRKTVELLKTDYTYWSSPVKDFTLGGIKLGTLYYSFNATGNSWTWKDSGTIMEKGLGYIVRGEGSGFDAGKTTVTSSFFGQPNNGNAETTVSGPDKSNLIGNPYPSAIDADAFLLANNTVLKGTLYFWTHKSAIQDRNNISSTAGSGAYAYTSDDYASYNLTGGAGTSKGGIKANSDKDNPAKTIPEGKIAAGQSFMATGLINGNVVFTNTMRLDSEDKKLDNTQFYRMASKKNKIKENISIEKNRVWINLTNDGGAFKQTLIGYITGATNGYDNAYDGESFNGNAFVNFYSINQNKILAIQGRALPFDESDSVPLGYKSAINGDFKIAIEQTDGVLTNKPIYLEDKLLGLVQNLTTGAYNFSTSIGTFNDRFVLRYTDRTLGNTDFKQLDNLVLISKDRNELKIKSQMKSIERITVFDLAGKKVFEKDKIGTNDFSSSRIPLLKQVGVVKVTLTTGKVIIKKIAF